MSIGQYNVSLDNVINNIDIPVDRNLSEQEINNIINQLNLGFDHVNNIKPSKNPQNLSSYRAISPLFLTFKKKKRAEIKLTGIFMEHNIPFRVMDHLVDALKTCFVDSNVSRLVYSGTHSFMASYTDILLQILKGISLKRWLQPSPRM